MHGCNIILIPWCLDFEGIENQWDAPPYHGLKASPSDFTTSPDVVEAGCRIRFFCISPAKQLWEQTILYIYTYVCVWNCVDMRSKQVNERNETTLLATHGYSFKCSLTCGRPQSDKTICSAVRVTKSVSSSGYVPPSPLKTNNRRQCLKDVESCLCESVLW